MERNAVKKCKKTLDILEIAATDKENVASKIHRKKMNLNHPKASLTKRKKNIDVDNNKTATQIKNNINKTRKDQSMQTASLLESDLTVDNPSENYWQNLAESCRKALDSALKENVDLHNKVNELEYENSRLKAMLDEAKSLVEVLTEMIQENGEESTEKAKQDSVLDESTQLGGISDSDVEDMSFQSCL